MPPSVGTHRFATSISPARHQITSHRLKLPASVLPQMAGHVLCNILRGHTGIYNAIKAAPGSAHVAVGIVHNVFWLEPKGKGPLYAHVR